MLVRALLSAALLLGLLEPHVDEKTMRLHVAGNETILKLSVTNPSGVTQQGQVTLDFIDTADRVVMSLDRPVTLQQGTASLDLNLGEAVTSRILRTQPDDAGLFRMRYRLTTSDSNAEAGGIVAVSQIWKPAFTLYLGTSQPLAGGKWRIHILASDPLTNHAVGAVTLSAVLRIAGDDETRVLKAAARTGASGFGALDFQLPPDLDDRDVTLQVTGQSGGTVREISSDVDLVDRSHILITTDKPLYQPGQKLQVRALLLDGAQRPEAAKDLEVTLQDPKGAPVYRTELKTSAFGEADAEWTIPENAGLGDYYLSASAGMASARQEIRVSRYDLPQFSVSAKPARPYYLPGQKAQIEVHADYLFGKPLEQGRVRLLEESRGHWDFREQKLDTSAGPTIEGALDAQGRFLATVDLETQQDELSSSSEQRFRDLRYLALVTDPATNRTEQLRFDVRISTYPIHVYVVQRVASRGLPVSFDVMTFYANGTPAPSKVSIYQAPARRSYSSSPLEDRGTLLRTVRTGSYGIARVTGLPLPADPQSRSLSLAFTADDGKGLGGNAIETFYLNDSGLSMSTDRTLYRAGDPIQVELAASYPDARAVVEILKNDAVITSRSLALKKGKALTVIPYRREFEGDVTLSAYLLGTSGDQAEAVRIIAYPQDHELKVDAKPGRAVYAPGDDATISFKVRNPEGAPQAGLLGVVIFDKALDERARTDGVSLRGACPECLQWMGLMPEFAGVNRRDLDRLDRSQPLPPDMELVADVLLNESAAGRERPFRSDDETSTAESAFSNIVQQQLKPFKTALDEVYARNKKYPIDETTLHELLPDLDWKNIPDPWGTPYRVGFSWEGSQDRLQMRSAGPDKQFDSPDDFTALTLRRPYFRTYGETIDLAARDYHARTGLYIRDAATLKDELQRLGQSFESWKDRWGQPYGLRFEVWNTQFAIVVSSSGANGVFETRETWPRDDFDIWTSTIDYSREARDALDQAVTSYYAANKQFPENQQQLEQALQMTNAPGADFMDPWGHRYYSTFHLENHYADHVTAIGYSDYVRSRAVYSVTPVTREVQFLFLRSAGPDGIEGTADDFSVAISSKVLAEQSAQDATARPALETPILSGSTGAITGEVMDETGAVIPGVEVQLTSPSLGQPLQTTTDDRGEYLFRNLPLGVYDAKFALPGFRTRTITDIPVGTSAIMELSVTIEVASSSEEVLVIGQSTAMDLESASVAVRTEATLPRFPQISTPKVRNYFPETLLWKPALETNRDGTALLKFKLADSVTTWKLAAVVSTMKGGIAVVEREIPAFQPFFIENDPPRYLTEGDQVSLPAVIRSYLDKEQVAEVSVKPESWFAASGATEHQTTISPGSSVRETFNIRALTALKDAPLRLEARGKLASDAMEMPVTIRPNGREVSQGAVQFLQSDALLQVTLPGDALPGTPHAELRFSPNLMSQVVQGIEGILQRPYGCAEQVISSAYPSLILLEHYKQGKRTSQPILLKAAHYLQNGYDLLRSYQTPGGGFSYWSHGAADIALTAYALRFLREASGVVTVEPEMVRRARQWLMQQQGREGQWTLSTDGTKNSSERARTLGLTALAARVLSIPEPGSNSLPKDIEKAVTAALNYLHTEAAATDEPYTLASMALAASNAGDSAAREWAVKQLVSTVRREGDAAYWDLQTNTPFYGWGLAGRLETTALVLQVLASRQEAVNSPMAELKGQALLFLLRNKDRFGVWHSSQATVGVLEALTAIVDTDPSSAPASDALATIMVNGAEAGQVALPRNGSPLEPIVMDVSKYLATGANRIEIRTAGSPANSAVQLVETCYVPWTHPADAIPAGSENALRLSIEFSNTTGQVGDVVTATVEAERIGFRGYGMMLAEIGLPPGAEVDRASLEQAMVKSGWDLARYDVLPDKIVAYLWPKAGGTKFQFQFRQRFGIDAQSAPSLLYDYYNPDARKEVPPTRFVIREPR